MVQERVAGDKSLATPAKPMAPPKNTPPPGSDTTPFESTIVQATSNLESEPSEQELQEYRLFCKFGKMRDLEKKGKGIERTPGGVGRTLDFSTEEEIQGASEEEFGYFSSQEDEREEERIKRRNKGKKKTDPRHVSSTFVSRQFKSPFTDDINETPIPQGLRGPKVKSYDGTGDPEDHLANFRWAVKMIPMDPRLWCLYFAGTLEGSARYWLSSLPQRSVSGFEDLARKFSHSFIQQKKFQQRSQAIMACRQREGESNRAYFKRFNEQSRKMPKRNDEI